MWPDTSKKELREGKKKISTHNSTTLLTYFAGRILSLPYVQEEEEKDDASSFNSKVES